METATLVESGEIAGPRKEAMRNGIERLPRAVAPHNIPARLGDGAGIINESPVPRGGENRRGNRADLGDAVGQ